MSDREKEELRRIAGNMGAEEMQIVASEIPTRILFDVLENRTTMMEEKVLSIADVMENRAGGSIRREISVIGGY